MNPIKESYQTPTFTWIDLVPELSLCYISGNVDGVNEEEWGTL